MSLPEEICDSLTNEPERWSCAGSGHYTIDRDDGLEVWIANGEKNVCLYSPQKVVFPAEWQRKIYEAYENRWRILTIEKILKGKKK